MSHVFLMYAATTPVVIATGQTKSAETVMHIISSQDE